MSLDKLRNALKSCLGENIPEPIKRMLVAAELALPMTYQYIFDDGIEVTLNIQPKKLSCILDTIKIAETTSFGYVKFPNQQIEPLRTPSKGIVSLDKQGNSNGSRPDARLIREMMTPLQQKGQCHLSVNSYLRYNMPGFNSGLKETEHPSLIEIDRRLRLGVQDDYIDYIMDVGDAAVINAVNVFDPALLVLNGIDKTVANDLANIFTSARLDKVASLVKVLTPRTDLLVGTYRPGEEQILTERSPQSIINYIIAADTSEARRHRRQFIESMIGWVQKSTSEKIFKPTTAARINNIDKIGSHRLYCDLSFILSGRNDDSIHASINSKVDAGYFPKDEVAKAFGVNHLSNNEFMNAIKSTHEIEIAICLAKIPESWGNVFLDNGDAHNIFMTPPHHKQIDKIKSNVGNIILPFLVAAGKKKGVNEAILLSLPKKNMSASELEIKKNITMENSLVNKQWEWLTKSDCPIKAIERFSSKYQIEDTYSDYHSILIKILESLKYRILLDNDGVDSACFDVCPLELKLNVNEKIHTFVAQEMHSINLSQHSNLLDEVKKNQSLHKKIGAITAELAGFIETREDKIDVSWIPLVDDDVVVGDYLMSPISSRHALLMEGIKQSHCVYNYLGKCLSGKSSIVSIRDVDTNEGVATLEIKQDGEKHKVLQCLMKHNKKVSEDVDKAVDIFIQKLNAGVICANKLGAKSQLSSKDLNHDQMFDLVSELYIVPFQTDAVYFAAAYLNKYLPVGLSSVSVLSRMGKAFGDSVFGKELVFLENIANVSGVSLYNVVEQCLGKTSPSEDVRQAVIQLMPQDSLSPMQSNLSRCINDEPNRNYKIR